MTPAERKRATEQLKTLWEVHDAIEREILLLERKFTDRELAKLGAAAA